MDHKIPKRVSRLLSDPDSRLFVSVISIWEILLKRQARKLWVEEDADTIVNIIRSQAMWRILPLEIGHIQALNDIARFSDHTDPFDRILIAQAHREGLGIVTSDLQFPRYGIEIVW